MQVRVFSAVGKDAYERNSTDFPRTFLRARSNHVASPSQLRMAAAPQSRRAVLGSAAILAGNLLLGQVLPQLN